MIAPPSAIIAAGELLEELAELGRSEACKLCGVLHGHSHVQDCLAGRAVVVLRALEGDDDAARALVDARTRGRRYRSRSTAGKLAGRAAALAVKEAVRS